MTEAAEVGPSDDADIDADAPATEPPIPVGEAFRAEAQKDQPKGDGPLPDDDRYLQQFREQEKELPGVQHGWLAELRTRAIGAYQRIGWPTTKQEIWKYTSLKPLRKVDFEPVTAARAEAAAGRVTEADLEPFLFGDLATHRLVLVDGRFAPGLSDLEGLPEGVTVASLAQVLEGDGPRGDEDDLALVQEHLARYANVEEQGLRALNTASFQDGALVHLAKGTVLDEPVHVVYASTSDADADPDADGGPFVTHPRTLVLAGESVEAGVIETYAGIDAPPVVGDRGDREDAPDRDAPAPYWTNAVTEIVAGPNAHLHHVRMEREDPAAFHTATQRVHQGRDSNVRTHNVCLGGKLVRNDVLSRMDGTGCFHLMNGLFVLNDEQHVDNYTRLDHAEPHCTSHQLYKGILDEKSRGVFYGTILVRRAAQQTDADQHNPNLLLSDEALVNTTPQLEIFADDVRCTHGSTFGQLPPEQVFYLRSRGLAEDVARSLLTYAFAGEVIEEIQVPEVRERVRDLVLQRLPEGELVRDAL